MAYSRRASIGFLALLLSTAATVGHAQSGSAVMPSAVAAGCDYATCALSIAPTWNGLAVVHGVHGDRVANLNFFWPREISGALGGRDVRAPGLDSAVVQARRAVRIRRIGAVLTDAGLAMTVIGTAGALHAGRARRSDEILAAAGIASLGLSVPFQFAADGALSRAVWWHNVRYGR